MAQYTHASADRFAQNVDGLGESIDFGYNHSIESEYIKSEAAPMPLSEDNLPLHVYVERAVRRYFDALGDDIPTDVYELILKQVELPLLTVVLEQTRGNQTKCAQILGLNRGTLRKKLKMYDLM